MRAVVIRDGGLELAERPDPVARAHELLVRVHAAGLNGADLLQRDGLYPPPPGVPVDIPGLELAGVVEGVGEATTRFAPGDRVMAVVAGGAQAELCLVPEITALPVLAGVDLVEAGGFPEAFTTAHDALFTQCGLRPGDRLLVNGAAGGVGAAAVQLGVLTGSRVVASVRAPELREDVAGLGATVVAPGEVQGHGPYDVILELVGAPNFPADLDALDTGGRIAVIGLGAGARAEIDLRLLMARRARVHGSTLRARPLDEKALAARRVEREVLPALAEHRVRVPLAGRYELGQVTAAYERFAAGTKFGKIVLVLGP